MLRLLRALVHVFGVRVCFWDLSCVESACLGVVACLQGLDVLRLLRALGKCDELVQTVVDHHQVCAELPLPWHQVPACINVIPL